MTDATQPVIAMTTPKPYPVPGRAGEKPRPSNASGFSLLELSIVIVIIALVAGVSIDMGLYTIEVVKEVANNHKLNVLEQALMSYRLANERLPCPTDATLATTSAYYGYEAGSLSGGRWVPDMGSCMTSGTYTTTVNGAYTSGTLTGYNTASSVAANYNVLIPKGAGATNIASNTYVAEGAVPFKALGLPEEFMYDAWGRKFAYAVWAPDTAEGAFLSYGITPSCGAITVNDASGNHRSQSSVYALVSFGPNGHGGYTKAGTRYFSGSDNGNGGAAPQPPPYAGEWTDCHCNATGDAGNYIATYVQKQWSEDPNDSKDTFDDTVRFKERWQMMDRRDLFSPIGLPCIPGFVITGYNGNTYAGSSAVNLAVGDINGDGIPDLVIGSSNADFNSGRIYVVFGTKQGFPNPLPVSTLDGTNGFEITSTSGYPQTGASIAVADVNGAVGSTGAPMDDIIVGNRLYNSNGAAFVIFGHTGTWAATSTLASYSDGVKGVEFVGPVNNETYNYPTVAAGDFNGDGIADMAIGMSGSPAGGTAYVVFGRKSGWPTQPITLSTAVTGIANNGSGLIRLTLSNTAPYAGTQGMITGNKVLVSGVVGTTEANGTWIATVVDATHIDLQGSTFTNAYISGGAASAVINGINGVEYDGKSTADYFGGSMPLAIGDVNGDNVGDLLVGAEYASPNGATHAGSLYVIFGKACGGNGTACTTPVTINASLLNGTTGVEYDGPISGASWGGNGSYFPEGLNVADVNGDKTGDIVTNTYSWGGNVGGVVVIYGRGSGWPSSAQLVTVGSSNYINSTNGFGLATDLGGGAAPYNAGGTLAVGDVNNDSKLDFLLGGTGTAGAGLLVFGQSSWPSVTEIDQPPYYNGITGVELDGQAGDTAGSSTGGFKVVAIGDLNGDGIPDLIIGAPNANSYSGSVYVYYGKKAGWPSTYNLGNL